MEERITRLEEMLENALSYSRMVEDLLESKIEGLVADQIHDAINDVTQGIVDDVQSNTDSIGENKTYHDKLNTDFDKFVFDFHVEFGSILTDIGNAEGEIASLTKRVGVNEDHIYELSYPENAEEIEKHG
jgi:hypothetical protein